MARATPQFLSVTLLGKLGLSTLLGLSALTRACTAALHRGSQEKCCGDFGGSAGAREDSHVGAREWVDAVGHAYLAEVQRPRAPPDVVYIPPELAGAREV